MMLINFTFRNYRSFREETCLSLAATAKCGQSERVLTVDRRRLLGAAAIFGPNGAGKSNVLGALAFMSRCVLGSAERGCLRPEGFGFGDRAPQTRDEGSGGAGSGGRAAEERPEGLVGVTMKGLGNKEREPGGAEAGLGAASLFEVEFIAADSCRREIYKYGFVLEEGGVAEEWLSRRARYSGQEKILFQRKGLKLDCSAALISRRYRELALFQEAIRQRLSENCLLLSLAPLLGEGTLVQVYTWFLHWDFACLQSAPELAELKGQTLGEMAGNEEMLRRAAAFLRSFDGSVAEVRTEERQWDKSAAAAGGGADFVVIHRQGTTGGRISVPWREESAGLRTLLLLYPRLSFALEGGGLLAVDGLGGQLHPRALGELLRLFGHREQNPRCAQLIFTSHDVWQIYNDALRQDQVWLAEKDEDGGTVLYSLADFAEDSRRNYYFRRTGSYCRRYMAGEFGGAPETGRLSIGGQGERAAEEERQ